MVAPPPLIEHQSLTLLQDAPLAAGVDAALLHVEQVREVGFDVDREPADRRLRR
jgi:hypothetical protein